VILLLQFKDGVVTVPRDSLVCLRCSVIGFSHRLVTVSFENWFYQMEEMEAGERMENQSDQ
jgi:hypothetical protein